MTKERWVSAKCIDRRAALSSPLVARYSEIVKAGEAKMNGAETSSALLLNLMTNPRSNCSGKIGPAAYFWTSPLTLVGVFGDDQYLVYQGLTFL
jgi:hypothetical protein